MYIKDVQTKGMVSEVEAGALSAVSARDVEAALMADGVVASIRREIITVLVLASAFVIGAILFLLLL